MLFRQGFFIYAVCQKDLIGDNVFQGELFFFFVGTRATSTFSAAVTLGNYQTDRIGCFVVACT